jgi:hypothetical protein
MNERIREFEKQCWSHQANCLDAEKFAELIIRECIDTAFHKGHPDLEFLLKHFGVEE